MARTITGIVTRPTHSPRRRKHAAPNLPGSVLKIMVVEVPADWRPARVLDLPPECDVVDLDGPLDAQLVREIQTEFNIAELIARRHGKGKNLWMLAHAVDDGGDDSGNESKAKGTKKAGATNGGGA